MAMCARANRRWTVLVGLLLLLFAAQVATAGTATVVLQNGTDGYAGASDDARAGALKLTDDRKSTDPRYPNPDYRHLLRFADLGRLVLGKGVKVVSAEVSLRYYDEWWSVNVYHLSLSRSQDGTVDAIASRPEDAVLLYGDRFEEKQKTPRPSWVTWKLRPETVQQWLAHPEQNRGLVLRVAERDSSRGDAGNYGVTFRGCEYGMARERPRLTVTYTYTGNLPPQAPQWAVRYENAVVGREHVLRWSPAREGGAGTPPLQAGPRSSTRDSSRSRWWPRAATCLRLAPPRSHSAACRWCLPGLGPSLRSTSAAASGC
jgi:hypothetical protein